jgi:hypothetical protein
VLVTPNMLIALRNGGFADQEMGALLATDRVIPVSCDVTFDELRAESPLLAARAGLSTADSSLVEGRPRSPRVFSESNSINTRAPAQRQVREMAPCAPGALGQSITY